MMMRRGVVRESMLWLCAATMAFGADPAAAASAGSGYLSGNGAAVVDARAASPVPGATADAELASVTRDVLLRLARADAALMEEDPAKARAALREVEALLGRAGEKTGAVSGARGPMLQAPVHLPIGSDPELDRAVARLRPYRPRDATAVQVDLRAIARRVRRLVGDSSRLGTSSVFVVGSASLSYVETPPTALADDRAHPATAGDQVTRQPG